MRYLGMFGKIINFLDRVLTFFEEWTLFISVIVALVALFFNVVLRYGFNYSLAWSDHAIRTNLYYSAAALRHEERVTGAAGRLYFNLS